MKKFEEDYFIEHIKQYHENLEDFKKQVTYYMEHKNLSSPVSYRISPYLALQYMCEDGFYLVYYGDILDLFREIYGLDYDGRKYITKNGNIRFKNGEAYCWTIYKNKLGMAGEKLFNKM